ncbi:amidohydrolase family protein [uncultured Paraglaciecola sp.]|uniref:amidohydrolase family protein n=1 Tax=uncultured Paraglaciecola sp. TaxID=1765024 RepID=UPI002637E91D|nr:amidohydrolase family protein [uncultured Paraglaciecola sp.]
MTALSSHCDGRVIHDADSHIVEGVGFMESFASKYVLDNLDPPFFDFNNMDALKPFFQQAEKRLKGEDPELTAKLKANVLGDPQKINMWAAYGAKDNAERRDSLDLIGINKQLVFPGLVFVSRFAKSNDLEVIYGGSEAHNRGMVEFCSEDPERLLAVGYLSLKDPVRALASAKQSIEMGVKSLWIHSDAYDDRAPSHIDYDPIWALMEEAGVPISLHIGSGARLPAAYANTGVKREFGSGKVINVETTSPKDVPILHHSIERWLMCMIYDGVLERFPKLKVGLIELGANWLPACMFNLDMGAKELGKFDLGLKKLSLKPSEYITRQVRATPLHFEDTGWILRNVGKEVLMFNTDYPHPEGGADPFGDFQRSLDAVNATKEELDAFYSKNFEDLMGL